MNFLLQLIIIFMAYLLGCIAVGYYLVRLRTGQDLRELGSGATGGRNTGRVLGRSGAIVTAVGDVLKGVIAMAITLWFNSADWVIGCVMVAVLVGHVWPIQLGFRGGKGLSAAFGAVLIYDYRIALLTAAAALGFLLLKRSTVTFMLGVAFCPLIAYLLGEKIEIVSAMILLVVVILYAHRDNLKESLNHKKLEK